MNSTQLYYFKAIAESGSLTRAASQVHISQPALSKSLALLEKELGTDLFNRIGGRLYLNADGKALLVYARQMDDLFRQIEERYSSLSNEKEELSIYSTGNYFAFILKNYFQYETRPLNLKNVPGTQIPETLFSGEADAAIADDRYMKPSPELGIKCIPILNEQLLLMIPKTHPLSNKKAVALQELADYPIMRQNNNFWIEDVIRENNVNISNLWSVDNGTREYYWSTYSQNAPLMFDTSASFVTQNNLRNRTKKCSIAKVCGQGTNRMLFLWYFIKNEPRLRNFLNCVKDSFQ